MDKDTLYFDGACPLCSAEIAKLARFSRGRIDLVDIHELKPGEVEIDSDELLARLHLQTADGEWITGLGANVRAWRQTPFRHLWRILEWPLVRPVSHRAYEYWARKRIRTRSCNTSGQCGN